MKTSNHGLMIDSLDCSIRGLANRGHSKGRLGAILCLALCLRTIHLSFNLQAAPGDLKWEFQAGGPVRSSPAIGSGGTVYVGSWDNKVYALEGTTGQKKWQFSTEDAVDSSPAIGVDGTVYVGSYYQKAYALDGTTGQKKWEFMTELCYVVSCPAIGRDGTVYIGAEDHRVYAFDGAKGLLKWSYLTGGQILSSPALGADGTVYIGSDDNKVCALDGATGQKKWEFLTGGWVWSSPAIGADSTVYVGSDDRKVYALAGATGEKKWEFLTGDSVESSPVIGTDGTVYVGSNDRKVYALDGTTGQKRWEFLTGDNVKAAPALGADGTVYIGSYDNYLYALDGATGQKQWAYLTGGKILSAPAIGGDGTVYVGSGDGMVYALVGNSSGGLASSPWPMFRGNTRRTGRAPIYSGPPRIEGEPIDLRVTANSTNRVGVVAEGALPFSYQWYFQGAAIPQATNEALVWAPVRMADAGEYFATISNALGMVTSRVARLTVGYALSVSYDHEAGMVEIKPDLPWYEAGSQVELRATAFAGQQFVRWSGDASGSTNSLRLVMDSNKRVIAEFSVIPLGAPGQVKWEYSCAFPNDQGLALATDGTVYALGFVDVPAGAFNYYFPYLKALDGASGKEKWQSSTHNAPYYPPAIGNDLTVYMMESFGASGRLAAAPELVALDGSTGATKWELNLSAYDVNLPSIGQDGTIYFQARCHYCDLVPNPTGEVYAVDGNTGARKWRSETELGLVANSYPAVGANGTVYVTTPRTVYGLDAATGGRKWESRIATQGQTIGLISSALALGWDGTVYFGLDNGNVYALDGFTGLAKWNTATKGKVASSPVVGADGTTFVAPNNIKYLCTTY